MCFCFKITSHGLHNHAGSWAPLAKELATVGAEVWSFDYRGHGKSEGTFGHLESLEALVSDCCKFVELVAKTYEDQNLPLFLYGFSLGGLLANITLLRTKAKIAGLLLGCPALTLDVLR